jgi:DNA uptake protein ComE-like DNA-binding protein
MKRKYILLVLFFILAIFFIISAPSVNAKMYKILDSEGNVIRLTNIPVLSIQEKEAGYTISPPPEEGTNIEENLADDMEKGNIKKEVETQTEALIKELENQTKVEIKFIDSTSRLEGNYYYVEGILKNNGKGNVSYVKVGIRALDKYGKLVSINDGYADPHTLAPGQEATYQIMVAYDSKIDKFDKTVSGSVETQTEALIKEKYKIKIVDWNNRLSTYGSYIYVEGSLKNIGDKAVEEVRVKVKSLDSNREIVSIDDGYTDPSLIAPNKEGIFQIMVKNNYKIKEFSLIVLTKSTISTEVIGVKEKPLAKQIININTASLEELVCVRNK